MRKLTVALLGPALLLTLAACVTSSDPEDTIREWVLSMENRDIDGVMDAYWEDAVVSFAGDADSVLEGKAAIRDMQSGFIGNPDAVIDIDTSGLSAESETDGTYCEVVFDLGDFDMVNRFLMTERNGRWGIQEQTVFPR